MNAVIETAAVLPLASALVNLVKYGLPTAPAWALMLVSLVGGIGGSCVVSLAAGHVLTTQLLAQDVVVGVGVALAAAGLDRAAVGADRTRTVAQMDQAREQFEARGVQAAPR